jgi:hypothetical protein
MVEDSEVQIIQSIYHHPFLALDANSSSSDRGGSIFHSQQPKDRVLGAAATLGAHLDGFLNYADYQDV